MQTTKKKSTSRHLDTLSIQQIFDIHAEYLCYQHQLVIGYHTLTGLDSADSFLDHRHAHELYLCGQLFLRQPCFFPQTPYSCSGDVTLASVSIYFHELPRLLSHV